MAVVATAIGAGLVLLAASRAWSRETVAKPPPLSPQLIVHTGASLAPALPALGLVALAGAGGLLATRGAARRAVGALLVAAGVGILALAIRVLAAGGVGAGWPALVLVGAVLVAAAGVLAVRDGARWPVMGSRYGRATRNAAPASPARSSAGTVELWDAIERGEDPTR
ncbi:MAG TPA: Trp biosynthesis-associated membrane protein [Micromonosporaceae bacterium]|jgi:hypothetical protein